MILLFSPTGFIIEAIAFFLTVVVFVLALRFFRDSRRRLNEAFPGLAKSRLRLPFRIDRDGFLLPKKNTTKEQRLEMPVYKTTGRQPNANGEEIKNLYLQLQRLEKALEDLQFSGKKTKPNEASITVPSNRNELNPSHPQTLEKATEVQHLKQQAIPSQALLNQLADLETELEKEREITKELEKEAAQATELSVQLANAEAAQARLEQSLLDKEEKLRELMQANSDLRCSVITLQEQLTQANQLQQQLLSKTQAFDQLAADSQQITETNKKLQCHINRVAELESMIDMIAAKK